MSLPLIALLTVVSAPIFFILISIRIVHQEERAVVERFGKYVRFCTPGLTFIIPIVERILREDIRTIIYDIKPQTVITKDNVEIRIDGIMWARLQEDEESVKKSFYVINNWEESIQELVHTNLRQQFGKVTLDTALTSRKEIVNNILLTLTDLKNEWGIVIENIEIKEIAPPNDIINAMHQQKGAEQKRRAAKITAIGQFEAAEQLKLVEIQRAEGEKQSNILRAEGKAESILLEAEAKAKAIELVNISAEKFFVGNAQELKKLEAMESSLKYNSKIILTKDGVNPSLIIGELPVNKDIATL